MSVDSCQATATVRDLQVRIDSTEAVIVDEVQLTIAPGEMVGLVGESGSGKTTIGTSLLAHARRGATITHGQVDVAGVDLLALAPDTLASHRGRTVAYVPQDPGTALNPAMRLVGQLSEPLEIHSPEMSRNERMRRIEQVLGDVRLPVDRAFLRRYVHELSGGQQQRFAMAMAFILRPSLIVLDEPTTGLDVTTQAHILKTITELCSEHRVAALYVSHDLAVVAEIADRIAVAYAGRIVEIGTRDQVINRPSHPYTRMLFATIPDVRKRRTLPAIGGHAPRPGGRPTGCSFAPRCPDAIDECTVNDPEPVTASAGQTIRCILVTELAGADTRALLQCPPPRAAASRTPVLTVDSLSASYLGADILSGLELTLFERECLALVGESGSGKTTLARCLAGAGPSWTGKVRYRSEVLRPAAKDRTCEQRREIQYIFQSPYNSLNPRRTVAETLGAHLDYLGGTGSRARRSQVVDTLGRVALPAGFADRYPDELSGGERQRVAIARALICEPRVIICDEITSALDVSVQAFIVALLEKIQREQNVATLFITHNLALVRSIADRAIVLNKGNIVEESTVEQMFESPEHPYTRTLIRDTPSLMSAAE